MKKLILAAFALTTAAGVFAQGTIHFENRFIGQPINQTTHVYAPLSATDTMSIIGLAANDLPAGTTDFGGRVFIGASGLTGQYGASTTYAQLLFGSGGLALPHDSLRPVGGINTFRTGSGAGFLAVNTAVLSGTPPVLEDAQGQFTFEIAAWDNSSGLYPTWNEAQVAWLAGTIAAGHSAPIGMTSVGGVNPPPYLTQMGANITSFNLYFIPEPSTFALAGLGAAALLIFRRRK